MGDAILEIGNLKKNYKQIEAVKGISLRVERGEIYGLLGPNGSGKTTTLAIILGILKPSSGTFSWFGNGDNQDNRKRIGALLETPNFYPYLNAFDNLRIVARIKQVPDEDMAIRLALEKVDMLGRAKQKFRSYSLGMKQRLAIAAALLSNPEVLVLDEPTNGLDPVGIADIRMLIKSLAAEGKTIVIASHILDEMEKICTRVGIMRHGLILKEGPLEDFVDGKELVVIHSIDTERIKQILGEQIQDLVQQEPEKITFVSALNTQQINRKLAESGIFCEQIYAQKLSLEQAFFEIIEA
jgi:ABC-2 type transport system ATP-binding protein